MQKIITLILEYLPKIIDLISRQFGMGYDKQINDFANEKQGGNSSKRYTQKKGFKLLYTKWDSQRDNKYDPNKTCFPTSIAMCLRTLEQPVYGGHGRRKYLREDSENMLLEDLIANRANYKRIVKRLTGTNFLPRYVYLFWEWYINEKVPGFTAQYKVFTLQGLKTFIQRYKIPVVIGTKLTHAGHVVMCIGGKDEGLYINDPFGNKNVKYHDTNGYDILYKNKLLGKKKFNSIVIMHEV